MVDSLGSYLRRARFQSGRSQREIAGELGVGQALISRIESDRIETDIDVSKLAKAYGVDEPRIIQLKSELALKTDNDIDILPILKVIVEANPPSVSTSVLVRKMIPLFKELGSLTKEQINKLVSK